MAFDLIEEDIKNLEKYIELVIDKNYCDCNELNVICYGKYADGSKNIAESIKKLLSDYTRQKQINKEHQKENGLLREKVKELEAKLEFKQYGDLDDLRFEEYMNEFVPKQKIKDLKENIILQPVIVGGRRNEKTLEYGIKLGKMKACQELLQEEDK